MLVYAIDEADINLIPRPLPCFSMKWVFIENRETGKRLAGYEASKCNRTSLGDGYHSRWSLSVPDSLPAFVWTLLVTLPASLTTVHKMMHNSEVSLIITIARQYIVR